MKKCDSKILGMEHFRWNISQLNFKIGQKTVCGTAVSWFWAKLGVSSDDEKGVEGFFLVSLFEVLAKKQGGIRFSI